MQAYREVWTPNLLRLPAQALTTTRCLGHCRLTTLGVNTRPSWSVRPTEMSRSTISSSAELEGAHTWRWQGGTASMQGLRVL